MPEMHAPRQAPGKRKAWARGSRTKRLRPGKSRAAALAPPPAGRSRCASPPPDGRPHSDLHSPRARPRWPCKQPPGIRVVGARGVGKNSACSRAVAQAPRSHGRDAQPPRGGAACDATSPTSQLRERAICDSPERCLAVDDVQDLDGRVARRACPPTPAADSVTRRESRPAHLPATREHSA